MPSGDQVNLVEDLITHLYPILEQLGFEGGSNRLPSQSEPMQDVVEYEHRTNPMVDNPLQRLPNDF